MIRVEPKNRALEWLGWGMAIGIALMLMQKYFRPRPAQCLSPANININGTITGIELTQALTSLQVKGRLSEDEVRSYLGKPYCTKQTGDIWLIEPRGTLTVQYQNGQLHQISLNSPGQDLQVQIAK